MPKLAARHWTTQPTPSNDCTHWLGVPGPFWVRRKDRKVTSSEPVIVAGRSPAYTLPANVTGGHGGVVPREILAVLQAPATDHGSSYFDAFMH